jgi:hypothetical protein
MSRKLHLPGPAMVVALVALFVALSGTAVAAGVPALAKRALIADNAKKLGGKTSVQLLAAAAVTSKSQADAAAAAPGPASTTAGLTVIKSQSAGSLPSGAVRAAQISCDSGQTVVAGGLSSDGLVATFDSFPVNATTWEVDPGNLGAGAANVSIYAVCQK